MLAICVQGKLMSNSFLEWETKDTYADYMRTTLYAGEYVPVKRMRKLQVRIASYYFSNVLKHFKGNARFLNTAYPQSVIF